MKTRAPILTLWRSTIFFVIGAVAFIFALQYMCVPTLAQEQRTTAPQPVESQPKPPEPAPPPAARPAEPTPPAATPAEKPEVKPEAEKQEAAPAKAKRPRPKSLLTIHASTATIPTY